MKNFCLKDTLHNRYVKHIKDGLITLTKDIHEARLFTIVGVLEMCDILNREYGPDFIVQHVDAVVGPW